ncbi:MAG: LysR substrate-binding domain-containing protein [Myxococcota bacterium]
MARTEKFPGFAGLKAFYAVGRASGVAQAAARLGVSRSAVSHQLRNLECELGLRLYDRQSGRLRLTVEGERYLHAIEEPMRQIQEATAQIHARSSGQGVALTMNPSFASSWFLPRMQRINEALPRLELTLVATTRVLDLKVENVELAIRRGRGSWPGLESILLFHDRVVPLVAPALLESTGAATLDELLERSQILVNANLPNEWDEWTETSDVNLAPDTRRFVLDSYELALDACRDGLGVTLGRRPFVDGMLARGEVVAAFDHAGDETYGYYLAWRGDTTLSSMADQLRRWLEAESKSC